eukprot:evm.model.scf_5383.1 EVM.evm.TU.scf_5383.1   scf_5383:153-1522(-)
MELFSEHFLDSRRHQLFEYFTDDWQRAKGDPGQILEPGHHLEWIWLIDQYERGAGRSGISLEAIYRAVASHGLEAGTGFAFDEIAPDGTVRRATKRLWPQTEALKAMVTLYRRGSQAVTRDQIEAFVEHLFEHYLDEERGTWRDQLDTDQNNIAPNAPASSLYHVFVALVTYLEFAGMQMSRERVAFYIDGFNMYHAIHDLNAPHLKWVNLRKLSELLIHRKSQQIVRVAYFSAIAHYFQNTEHEGRIRRHEAYIHALKAKGVECILGNFAKRDHYYRGAGFLARWRRREEKQTDVAIGVEIMRDAFRDIFDRALIVSLDTDMLPVFRVVKSEFPNKKLISVAPPSRAHHRTLLNASDDHLTIRRSQIEKALFGKRVAHHGRVVAYRPKEYNP